MDIDKILTSIIPESMLKRAETTLDAFLAPIRDLMNRKQFPDKALKDSQIELLVKLLSSMDTDKDPDAARVGEREGRVASPFVEQLAAGFNHGIGRSGQLIAPQPKATGASIMQGIANNVAVDALRKLGLPNIQSGFVLPISTGMTIGLVLAALRRTYNVDKVLFPRIDHRSPHRGIALVGFEEIVVPTILKDDAVGMDLSAFETMIQRKDDFVVLTTTTFFPPRETDPVKTVARLCQENDIPHIVNNAYGVQSEEIMKLLQSAIDAGRVDAIIQSTDKNFMTPVGGAIVCTPSEKTTSEIAETFAGRASAAPVVQTLAALLALGLEKYQELRVTQRECKRILDDELNKIAESIGQRVLDVKSPIAAAVTLDGLDATKIGAHLYNLRVTGPRAVEVGSNGSCIDDYPHAYLVMNAAIGVNENDIKVATAKAYKELSSLSKIS